LWYVPAVSKTLFFIFEKFYLVDCYTDCHIKLVIDFSLEKLHLTPSID
jgi:hypothetical protein